MLLQRAVPGAWQPSGAQAASAFPHQPAQAGLGTRVWTREAAWGCPQQARGGTAQTRMRWALRQRAAAETAQREAYCRQVAGWAQRALGQRVETACYVLLEGRGLSEAWGQKGAAGRQRQQARQPWVQAMQPRRLAATRVTAGLWGGVLWDQELAGVAWDPKQRGQEDLSKGI